MQCDDVLRSHPSFSSTGQMIPFCNFHTCPSVKSVFLDSTSFSRTSFQLHFLVPHPQSAPLSDLESRWPLQQHCVRPSILLVIGTTYAVMTILRSSNKLLCLCPYSYPCLRLVTNHDKKKSWAMTVFTLVPYALFLLFRLDPGQESSRYSLIWSHHWLRLFCNSSTWWSLRTDRH